MNGQRRPRPPMPRETTARRHALRACAGIGLATVLSPLVARKAAAAGPTVRARLAVEGAGGRLEVGDAIEVRLEVWVSTWFQAPVDFPATLNAEGALVTMVGGSPDSRFEEAQGLRWTGLIRRYRVLPAQAGAVTVAVPGPLEILAGGGDGRVLRVEPSAPLRLTVQVPRGAEDLQPFVAARRLELRQRWWPQAVTEAASLQVGDLIRREIVLVTDSTSPLLPAPDAGTPAGVAVRMLASDVQEQRADAAATPTLTRRHEVVYTLQQAGRVDLPSIEWEWWDLQQRRRRVTRLDGLQLEVKPASSRPDPFAAPAPPAASVATGARDGPPTAWGLLLAAVGAGAALVALRRRRSLSKGDADERQTVEARGAWSDLRRACRADDAAAASRAFGRAWSTLPVSARPRWQADATLCAALEDLERDRFGRPGPGDRAWRGDALWQAVRRLRRSEDVLRRSRSLPTLHP